MKGVVEGWRWDAWKTPSGHGGYNCWGRGQEGGRCSGQWGTKDGATYFVSEGGDVRGWVGTPGTNATFGWRRKVAQVDCLKASTLPELYHSWKLVATFLSLASLRMEEGNTVLCAYTAKSCCCWIKMLEEVHPRDSVLERIFLKEAHRVGQMW